MFLLLFGCFGFLQAQVSKLVYDEVELAEGDLFARLHLLCVVIEIEDDTHLKHNKSVCERPQHTWRTNCRKN